MSKGILFGTKWRRTIKFTYTNNFIWILRKKIEKFITKKIFIFENSVWRQMKENYQIYILYQFYWKPQSALWDHETHNFLIRKWKPYFSQICQKVEDWLRLFFPTINVVIESVLSKNDADVKNDTCSLRCMSSMWWSSLKFLELSLFFLFIC